MWLYLLGLLLIVSITIVAIGAWWRYRSLACPASASWLLDNPVMNALVGAQGILPRIELREGMRLLDVGCGPGRLTIPAARWVGPHGVVVALDIQPKMLERLQHRIRQAQLHNIHPILGGAGKGLIERNYFDRVLLVTVLGEIHNQHEALQEIFDALKPGGMLSVSEVMLDPHYTRRGKLERLCDEVGFHSGESFRTTLGYTCNFIRPVSS